MYVHIVLIYVCVCGCVIWFGCILHIYNTCLGIMDGDGFSRAVDFFAEHRHWRNASHVLRIDPREPQQIDVQIVGGASMELLVCRWFIVLFLRGRLFHGICGVDFGKCTKLKPVGGADLGLGAGKWRPGSMEHGGDGGVKLLHAGILRSGVFGADGHVYCPPWCSRHVPPGVPSPDPLCTWQDEHGSPFVTFPNMTQ